jgi:hypothetical protein
MLEPEKLDKMVESIRRDGLIHPILTFRDEIIDGRNRLRACELAGVQPSFQEWSGGQDQSPTGLILSLNIDRRHLNSAQKAALAVEALPFFEAEAAERQKAGQKRGAETTNRERGTDERLTQKIESSDNRKNKNEKTAEAQAAQHAHTNRQYVHLLKKVKEDDPERFERVRDGKESLAEARRSLVTEVRRERKRRGGKIKRKAHKAKGPLDEGQSKRQQVVSRTHEAAIRCAEAGRALSDTEIAKIADYKMTRLYGSHGSGLDYFLTLCAFIPWLEVRTSAREDGELLRQFSVNQNLKNICDARGFRTGQGTNAMEIVAALAAEIRNRREERQQRVRRANWDATGRVEMSSMLDMVEGQLQLILNPDLSLNTEEANAS